MKHTLSLILLTVLLNQQVFAQDSYQYQQPTSLADGWQTNDLKSTVKDSTRLYAFFNQIADVEHKLHSVLLIKNEQLIVEEYFNGYATQRLQDLRSVNKSIKSLLLGIAIDKGFIDDINDPITKYLKTHHPEKRLDSLKETITIKHLITMSAGWDCNDWNKRSKGQEDRVYKKDDWIQYTLDLPLINPPGTVSTYCSMGVLIMAEMIEQASGLSIDQFAKQYLFDPLNIKHMRWSHTSKKAVTSSSKRLYLTPRDLAKIGQLVLNEGRWSGQQIVSAEWIKSATTPKTSITGIDYGYLWWNIPFKVNGRNLVSKTATGNGGQYIIVIPALKMVAIFTGKAYNSAEDKLPFAIMQDVLLPSFDDHDLNNHQ